MPPFPRCAASQVFCGFSTVSGGRHAAMTVAPVVSGGCQHAANSTAPVGAAISRPTRPPSPTASRRTPPTPAPERAGPLVQRELARAARLRDCLLQFLPVLIPSVRPTACHLPLVTKGRLFRSSRRGGLYARPDRLPPGFDGSLRRGRCPHRPAGFRVQGSSTNAVGRHALMPPGPGRHNRSPGGFRGLPRAHMQCRPYTHTANFTAPVEAASSRPHRRVGCTFAECCQPRRLRGQAPLCKGSWLAQRD